VADVSIRELRHRGGDVVDRVARGEHVVVTRDGRAVAELRPASLPTLSAAALIERRRNLPPMDALALRRDLDEIVDPTI
jgi:prevent-host-death family protein